MENIIYIYIINIILNNFVTFFNKIISFKYFIFIRNINLL